MLYDRNTYVQLSSLFAAALLSIAGCQDNAPASPDLGTPLPDFAGQPPQQVTFHYTPAWSGVTAVSVIGGFGMSTDWSQPFLHLTADASGTFSGSVTVPAGAYPYLFLVTGDSDAATPATALHDAIDPSNPSYVACPAASPTYSTTAANPCSQLITGAPASPTYHITGIVNYNGKPAAGYLVVVERDEANSHHYFANRMDSKADGSFDLQVTTGLWRIQVEHPSFEKLSDASRASQVGTLQAMRRAYSPSFQVNGAVALTPVEMANTLYNTMTPASGTTTPLPVNLQFSLVPGATMASADVYGLPSATAMLISDPWFSSTAGSATTVPFNGTFNTAQKGTPTVTTGVTYYWGTTQQTTAPKNGNSWFLQSMVLSIVFQ